MLVETELAWRFFDQYKLTPQSTQDCVAWGGLGTRCDVVVKDDKGRTRVLEFKR